MNDTFYGDCHADLSRPQTKSSFMLLALLSVDIWRESRDLFKSISYYIDVLSSSYVTPVL
jgi:hypothetical protein